MRPILLATITLLAVALSGSASGRDPWESVGLKPGMHIVVTDIDGDVHEGRFVESPSDAILFDSEDGRAEMSVSYIAAVQVAKSPAELERVFATWANLRQLPAKTAVRVWLSHGPRVEGLLESVTNEALHLTQDGKALALPRGEIRKVALTGKDDEEFVFLPVSD